MPEVEDQEAPATRFLEIDHRGQNDTRLGDERAPGLEQQLAVEPGGHALAPAPARASASTRGSSR